MTEVSVFDRQVLPSGLRLLTADMPTVQSVTCFVMLAAGSRYERADSRGIAHFAEHMFFKGTERRPTAKDIATEVDAIGGEFNAFTGKEYTGYYIRCAAADRDHALDVLVDMIRHSKFDVEELEREKGVILEEMNMYFDTPRDYIGALYEELMFGDNPLGWETLGTRDTIKAATRDNLPRLRRHLVSPRPDGRRRRREHRPGPARAGRGAARRPRRQGARRAGSGPAPERQRAARARAPQGLRPGAPLDRRAELSARPPRPLRAAAPLDGARQRHVVAALHRGARAARPRLLRPTRSTTATPTPARSTRRPASTSIASTMRSRRSPTS